MANEIFDNIASQNAVIKNRLKSISSFESEKDGIRNWLDKNPILSTFMAIGSVALLGKGRAFQRIAGNMQQFIKDFYTKGGGKLGKMGAFSKEAFKAVTPATRQVFNQRLNRAYKQHGFSAGQKKDLDRVFKGYSMVLNKPESWVNKINTVYKNRLGVLQNPKLTEEAAKQITFLGKQEMGVMHNAFAQQVKTLGINKAKKSPLYNLIKDEAKYTKYGVGGKPPKKLFKEIGIKDKKVGEIALDKWNQGLVPKLRGIHKDTKSINVANFRHSAMQNSVRDAQFSSQAKIAFLAHEKGLMEKGAHLSKLAKYFQKRGYGEELIEKSAQHYIVKGKTYVVNLHKTKQGSTLVNFSPARKSNYHWGGFNGNLVFNNKLQKGKVGIFGTDVYDIEIMKMKGDKWANFRKTPLLNVQNVKYKNVPIISKDPKKWVQKKPKLEKRYNRKVFNDEKMEKEFQQITDTGKYGVKETQSISPHAEERFKVLAKPTKGRLKGGAIKDARGLMSSYSRHTVRWNKAVEDYYRLYTKNIKQGLTQLEKVKFASTRTLLGIGGAGVAGSVGIGAYYGGKAIKDLVWGDD